MGYSSVDGTGRLFIYTRGTNPSDRHRADQFPQTRAPRRAELVSVLLVAPGSPARFSCRCGENPSRRRGITIFCAIGAAVSRGEPRNDGAENGTRRVTAARFARFCQLDFTRRVVPLHLLSSRLFSPPPPSLASSPRRRGKYHASRRGRAFNSALRYVPPFPRRGEFLPRSSRHSRKWNKRKQRRNDRY